MICCLWFTYAGDTRVYISAPVVESRQAATCLSECIKQLDCWTGAERSEAECREDPTDVAWITASTSQADRLSAHSGDNYVVFND